MKNLFVVTRTFIESWELAFDDITVDTSVELFNTLEEAQAYVKDEIEYTIEDFCNGDEDDMEEFGDDGYSEKNIGKMESYIAMWDENGGGQSLKLTIEKKEF